MHVEFAGSSGGIMLWDKSERKFFANECMHVYGKRVLKLDLMKSFERCFSKQLSTNMRNILVFLQKKSFKFDYSSVEGVSLSFGIVVIRCED